MPLNLARGSAVAPVGQNASSGTHTPPFVAQWVVESNPLLEEDAKIMDLAKEQSSASIKQTGITAARHKSRLSQ